MTAKGMSLELLSGAILRMSRFDTSSGLTQTNRMKKIKRNSRKATSMSLMLREVLFKVQAKVFFLHHKAIINKIRSAQILDTIPNWLRGLTSLIRNIFRYS
jgi:hypothetical protein